VGSRLPAAGHAWCCAHCACIWVAIDSACRAQFGSIAGSQLAGRTMPLIESAQSEQNRACWGSCRWAAELAATQQGLGRPLKAAAPRCDVVD
jgi:hypothetical protein